MVHLGLVPPNFTGEDLNELFEEGGTRTTYLEDGTRVDIPPRNPNPTLPGGRLLFDDEEVGACIRAPRETMERSSPSPWNGR